ncbi:MAG: hypothetical protein ACKO83_07450, partial [Roseiflexaceae bacterium]
MKLRWYISRIVLILLCMLPLPSGAHAAAGVCPLADQQAAMHASARGDVASYADAPMYQIVGSVNPDKRTWQATQTITFWNQSGGSLSKLYFRLLANLPDVGGSLVLNSARVNGTTVSVKYEANRYLARLDLATALPINSLVTVVLSFVTTAANNGGEDVFGTLNSDGQTIALAMAYPLLANTTNGVWDTAVPDTTGDIITSPVAWYDVTLTTPRSYTVVS